MVKSPDAFRTISEVADELEVAQHVLRFWESKFSQLRPMKRGGGRRYYRPEDVELVKGLKYLLYDEGYTIRGVQRILKEQGAKAVAEAYLAQDEDHNQPESVPDPSVATSLEPVIETATEREESVVEENEDTPDMAKKIIPADHIGDDDVKKLQATLFELSEIRRLLKETKES